MLLIAVLAILLSGQAGCAEDNTDEVGLENATRAAIYYYTEHCPEGVIGPAEPVYNNNLDGSVVAWFFCVDTSGNNAYSLQDMNDYVNDKTTEILGGMIYHDPSLPNGSLTYYQLSISHFDCFLISNYYCYGPLLMYYDRQPLPATVALSIQQEEKTGAALLDEIGLVAPLGAKNIIIKYTTTDGSHLYRLPRISTLIPEIKVRQFRSLSMNQLHTPYPEDPQSLPEWEKILQD